MKTKHLLSLSLLSGLWLWLAWPSHGFPALLFVAFVPLLFVEDYYLRNKEKHSRFAILKWGYLSFFVWNALTTWWIWNSTPFGAIMAIVLNALFMALIFTFFHITRRTLRQENHGIWLLVVYWLAFEYFHLDWDLSWPWLNLGNAFALYPKWIQWYEFTGSLGGSFWVLVANILLFKAVKAFMAKQKKHLPYALAFVGLIAVPLLVSFGMYANYHEKGKPVKCVVVQPNIDPWSEQYSLPVKEVFMRNVGLGMHKLDSSCSFLVCPESALQEDIWLNNPDNSESIGLIRNFITHQPQLTMIIGASTFKNYEPGEALSATVRKYKNGNGYYDAFNTAFVVDSTAGIGYYHKSKLVPGPEKLPFPQLLRPFQEFAFDLGGTVGSLGLSPERTVFTNSNNGLKYSAVVCYESIYGDFMAQFVRNGAELLFIITNDGWWGHTDGHRQHFSFAILRAIETRRSIARSANTGISGFVNQRGDVMQQTPYWQAATLSETLLANSQQTFYTKHGDYIGRLALFTAGLFVLLTVVMGILNRKKGRL